MIRVRNMNQTAIAIDLGGTAIKYGLTNFKGHVIWDDVVPTPHDSRASLIDALLQCIRKVLSATADHPPVCIGIGTPGMVDVENGYVLGSAFQLPGWENLPLADIIRKETGLPAYLDNDANMMALGEFAFGKAKNGRNVLFFTLGTGIGGAVFVDGKLYRGSKNAGGELGCFPMQYDGREGYWEDFASMKALTERYIQRAGGEDVTSAKQVFEKAAQGDTVAQEVIAENVRLAGRGLAGYINIFNPDTIIIGGGVSDTQPEYIARLKETALKYALKECSDGVEIIAASLGNKAGMVGAGYFALKMRTLHES